MSGTFMGADFWVVIKDKRGRLAGRISDGRYPQSIWRNLDIRTALFAAGPDGAVPTARFQMMREGVQECEARIFIEKALLDDALRAKLGEDLASRCQSFLDERTKAICLIYGQEFRGKWVLSDTVSAESTTRSSPGTGRSAPTSFTRSLPRWRRR